MTAGKGRPFPAFFMAEEGSRIRTYGEVRSLQEEGDGLGMPSLRVAAIYGAGRSSCQGGSDGGFVARYRGRGKAGRWKHCDGAF